MSVINWSEGIFSNSQYGYITSEMYGRLGEQFAINIYMQSNYLCTIYAIRMGSEDEYDINRETIIYSGYGGTTVYWTPPISDSIYETEKETIKYHLRYVIEGPSQSYGSITSYMWIPIYPSIINVSITDTSGHYDVFGKYIQYKSSIHVKVTCNIDSLYGAPLAKCTLKIADEVNNYTTDFTLNSDGNYECSIDFEPTVSGSKYLSIGLYDTRGCSVGSSQTLTFLQYDRPSVAITTPYRCDASGNALYNGSYACTTLTASASSLDDKNSLTAKLVYTISGTDMVYYSSNYTADSSLSINEQKIIFSVSNDEEYIIYAQCWDEIASSQSLNRRLLKVSPMLDIDRANNALGFGTLAKDPNTACFGPRIIFETGGTFKDEALFEKQATFEETAIFNQDTNIRGYSKNWLDNSDFTNVVNQGICTSEFVFDRWHGNCSVSSVSGTGITIPSGGKIWQIVDINDSALTPNGLPMDQFDVNTVFTLVASTTNNTLYVISGRFSDNLDNGVIAMMSDYSVRLYAGSYKWIALYEGSYTKNNVPLYHHKGYSEELRACKRYCQKFNATGVINYTDAQSTYNNYRRASLYFTQTDPMRTYAPTVTDFKNVNTTLSCITRFGDGSVDTVITAYAADITNIIAQSMNTNYPEIIIQYDVDNPVVRMGPCNSIGIVNISGIILDASI